jgi:rhamnosyltransferase
MTVKIAVVLPVYNGEKYIETQIDSILNQSHVKPIIYIKDDFSTDSSSKILIKLSSKYKNIKLIKSRNNQINASNAFYEMIENIPIEDYDYFSFCDQDDDWNSNKLILAIDKLNENSIDGYSSNIIAFWSPYKKKKIIKSFSQKKYDYMFESAGPGCTFVIKRKLFLSIKEFILDNKKEVYSFSCHDWFIYAYARSHNYKWFIDSSFTMKYRQHQDNEKGAHAGIKSSVARIKNIHSGWYAQEVWKLAKLLNYKNKLKELIKSPLNFFEFRRNIFDGIFLFVSYVLGYLKPQQRNNQKYHK